MERLKIGMATGGGGIANEVWKYRDREVREWAKSVCNKVWRGKGGQSCRRKG